MNIKNSIKNLLMFDDSDFRITILKNLIHIINYTEIKFFDDNNIIIYNSDEYINIKGKNLLTKRLLNNEVLIEGSILSIEFR